MPVTLICQYVPCSKPFTVKPYKADIAQFCSHQCQHHAKTAKQFSTFWDKVHICVHGFDCIFCCWPWEGTTESVYKNTTIKNKFVLVHRLAWQLGNNREIPDGLHIAHYCHFRPCCNFMHLHAATREENYADSIRDHRIRSGEQHHNSKLTRENAIKVFDLKMLGWTNQAIADHLHVSSSTITKLLGGQMWKDLPRPAFLPKQKPGPRPKRYSF